MSRYVSFSGLDDPRPWIFSIGFFAVASVIGLFAPEGQLLTTLSVGATMLSLCVLVVLTIVQGYRARKYTYRSDLDERDQW